MFLSGASSSVNSWRNLVVGGRAVVLAALCLGSVLACSNSDKPNTKPPTHEGGAPGAGGQSAADAGDASDSGGTDATDPGVGGAPDVIGAAGASNEPGSWDTSFWDDAVWQ